MKLIPIDEKYQIFVHLRDSNQNTEIRVYELKTNNPEDFELKFTHNIVYPELKLIDFLISNSKIWTLWRNGIGYKVNYSLLSEPLGFEHKSFPISLKVKTILDDIQFPYPERNITDMLQEDIVSKLFETFGVFVIQKVFHIQNVSRKTLFDLVMKEIKEEENRFDNRTIYLTRYNLLLKIWNDCKTNFQSLYCVSGIGLFDNFIGLINETGTSIFRASDPFESLEYLPENQRHLFTHNLLNPDIKSIKENNIIEDILMVINQVKKLNQNIDKESLFEFDKSLYLKDPQNSALECLKNSFSYSNFKTDSAKNDFIKIKSPEKAIEILISLLSLEMKVEVKSYEIQSEFLMDSIIVNILHSRYKFSRDLLLYLSYISNNIQMSEKIKKIIERVFITNLKELVDFYNIYEWLSIQTNSNDLSYIGIFYLEQIKNNKKLILDRFKYFSTSSDDIYFSAMALISSKLSFLYNIEFALDMANLLYEKDAYDLLEIFAFLLSKTYPIFKYYLGICSLKKKQLLKARDYFIQIIPLIEREEYVYPYFDITNKKIPLYNYLENIRFMFERFHNFNIEFAELAYSETLDLKEKNRLLSILFYSYIELEMYDSAYQTLNLQKDDKSKELNLEYLILILIEKGFIYKIITYPFHKMNELVEKILLKFAKKTKLGKRPHPYDILFSIHSKFQNFRKASEYSFIYAKELEDLIIKEEVNGIDVLFILSDLYSNSITSLSLCKNAQFLIFDKKLIKVNDIEKDYLINLARIKLYPNTEKINFNPSISTIIDNGYYELALQISNGDQEKVKYIFEQLTINVIRSVHYNKKLKIIFEEKDQIKTEIRNNSWNILKHYLDKYSSDLKVKIQETISFTVKNVNLNGLNKPNWIINNDNDEYDVPKFSFEK